MGIFFRIFRRSRLIKIGEKESSSTSLNSYVEPPEVKLAKAPLHDDEDINLNLLCPTDVYTPSSIANVPALVQSLDQLTKTEESTASEAQSRILRQIFAISEDDAIRGEMIADGTLIPCLVRFLKQCCKEQECNRHNYVQYSTKLQFPKQQPQLYLALLVLNNLSIPVANKRSIALESTSIVSHLMVDDPSCHLTVIVFVNWIVQDAALRRELVTTFPDLVAALVTMLRAASLTTPVYIQQYALASAAERVAVLVSHNEGSIIDLSDVVFPDTMRWCLTALHHLTRPHHHGREAGTSVLATPQLVNTGLVPFLLQCIRVNDALVESEWKVQSTPDAALSCLLNLSTDPVSRPSVACESLIAIVKYFRDMPTKDGIAHLQCFKARIALTYIGCVNDVPLRQHEIPHWIELLGNAVHRRPKNGPDGYTVGIPTMKQVVWTILSMLKGQPEHVKKLSDVRLNALLFKIVNLWAVQHSKYVDAQVAEYATIALYLLSHYGFQDCFLPDSLGKGYNAKSLVAKVLSTFREARGTIPSARHAATQLLLRLKYLVFDDPPSVLIMSSSSGPNRLGISLDYTVDLRCVKVCQEMQLLNKIHSGSKPRQDIFNRPIRCGFKVYPSALSAVVQDYSFGSCHVRHKNNSIDDVLIANNLARCADGKAHESYGFVWSWQDETEQSVATDSDESKGLSAVALAALNLSFCGCATNAKQIPN